MIKTIALGSIYLLLLAALAAGVKSLAENNCSDWLSSCPEAKAAARWSTVEDSAGSTTARVTEITLIKPYILLFLLDFFVQNGSKGLKESFQIVRQRRRKMQLIAAVVGKGDRLGVQE